MEEIKVRNLSVKYGKKNILKSINAEFYKGKLYGVIGPNGAGKSTFLSAISRLIKINSGEIFINEINIKKYSIKEMAKKISMMSQSFDIKFPYRVEEIVAMGRYPFSEDKLSEEDGLLVEKALKEAELFNIRSQKITELSGGEKQRVMFAKLLCQNTESILIDEGISNADIYYQIKFIKALKEKVQQENKLVIFILHDLNLARKFCDEILVLKDGGVYRSGKSEEVLNKRTLKEVFNVEGDFTDNTLKIE